MMLTTERRDIILQTLSVHGTVKLQQLVEATGASESTIRRDLVELEKKTLLKRVHGGAEAINKKRTEQTLDEKTNKFIQEKRAIAHYAAQLVEEGDCIFVDAGTTTLAFVEALKAKNVVIVTNGIAHLQVAIQVGLEAYITGGRAKSVTGAVVGRAAVNSLAAYRFDKCFIGVNGIHEKAGYTTPDPEEAMVKETAKKLSSKTYILADASKFSEVYFSHMFSLGEATIITDDLQEDIAEMYREQTVIEEVVK